MVYEQNKTKISENKILELSLTNAVTDLTNDDEEITIPKNHDNDNNYSTPPIKARRRKYF